VYNQLISKGKVSRGWLGVQMNTEPLNPVLARHFGVKDGKGVLVTELIDEKGSPSSEGPAAKAGLKADDVIVDVDGKKIETAQDLSAAIAETAPGKTIHVKVIRKGEPKTLNVQIAERHLEDRQKGGTIDLDDKEEPPAEKQEIGLTIDTIPAQAARELGIRANEGVLITEVKPGSLAEDAGLMAKDIIIEMNGKSVESPVEFSNRIKRLKSGDDVVIKVLRMSRVKGGDSNVQKYYFGFTKP
jgi:serine protease Do